eukprot:c32077_g1_i1.p1 GENE.c32077_g1_i1~~c32077_g1_i1.p1  ORF type:complete len:586 (-),score=158.90 c32077_g1_i1:93-1805(-)
MSHMMKPSIILLRDGTDTSQGRPHLISNINACQAVADAVRTTLGPRGMDKLIQNDKGVTISNDGATIMKLLDIVHPAAKVLVDIAQSQDAEVGDGTTSVVLLAGSLLNEAKTFVEEDLHPQVIIKAYRSACNLCLEKIKEIQISIEGKSQAERRELLEKCASTSLNSKLVSANSQFFGKMVVDAVMCLEQGRLDIDCIGIKKVLGGSLSDSFLVQGVAFQKTFSYAGFEQQPKSFRSTKIVLLNVELELKAEKENAEVRISDPSKYQSIVDAEWEIIYDKLDKIAASGVNVVLSRLAIGDLATQYFADRNIFCAGRVPMDDLVRVSLACGGVVQTSVNSLTPDVLGTCGKFEERQIGQERYNVFMECPKTQTATIVIRGGAEQFMAEAERSLHDSIMIVRRALKHPTVVGGGGAIEMELSKALRDHARTVFGKQQLLLQAFAKALEIIPRQVAENAGLDSTEILNKLRHKHANGGRWFGVDIINDGVCDTVERFVWEPSLVKHNSLMAATEAACMILSVDETVRNAQSGEDNKSMVGMGGAQSMMQSNLVRSAMGKSGPGGPRGKVLKRA